MSNYLYLKVILSFFFAFSVLHAKPFNATVLPARDITDLSLIYNETYQYSLPKKVLESFLSGKAFDHTELYTPIEAAKLNRDINALYQKILASNPIKEKIAIMTAGSPGSGKTLKLRQHLEANAANGNNYAYICPDDVALKHQTETYLSDLNQSDYSLATRQEAYNKWRPASNAATHLILGNLIRENYGFYFGTTSSGPATNKFFEFLKKQNYKIQILHVSADDDVRWNSILERDKTFVQTTEKDIREKKLLLPQRINDTFLMYADEIEFYYRDAVDQDAVLAAFWTRNTDPSPFIGTLHIINQDYYNKIKDIHNEAIDILKMDELRWEATIETQSIILHD